MNMSGILREPLFHFLLLGFGLFLLYGRVAPGSADQQRIEVNSGRIESLSQQFQSTWSRPPTEQELAGLIDSYVHDEVLYREGLAMGLDADDPVIKRRVRQKLEVMSEESGNQQAPSDTELSAYLAKHADKFRQAPIVSFEQVFFSGEGTVAEVERQSREAVAALNQGADPAGIGQATMLPARVADMPLDLVAREFGEEFAKKLGALPLSVWQGPVASGFGAHVVRISARRPAELPPLAEIRPQVLREWENDRRVRNRAQAYQGMLKNYEVIIDSKPQVTGSVP